MIAPWFLWYFVCCNIYALVFVVWIIRRFHESSDFNWCWDLDLNLSFFHLLYSWQIFTLFNVAMELCLVLTIRHFFPFIFVQGQLQIFTLRMYLSYFKGPPCKSREWFYNFCWQKINYELNCIVGRLKNTSKQLLSFSLL